MLTEKTNLPQFEAVRDSDEEILWVGKPAFIPFILSGIPFLIIGLIWGVLDIGFFGAFAKNPMMAEMSGFFYYFLDHSLVSLLGQYSQSAPPLVGLWQNLVCLYQQAANDAERLLGNGF